MTLSLMALAKSKDCVNGRLTLEQVRQACILNTILRSAASLIKNRERSSTLYPDRFYKANNIRSTHANHIFYTLGKINAKRPAILN